MSDVSTRGSSTTLAEQFVHPGVNTPPGLPRWALSLWIAKLRLQRLLLVMLGASLVLLVFVGVVSRYLLNTSIFWIEDAVSFSAVYLYFIGATHGTWARGHISASLVELIFPRIKVQAWIGVFTSAISTVLAGWMTIWTWEYLQFVIRRATVSIESGVPMSWIVAVLPATLGLMTFYFLVETFLKLRFGFAEEASS